MSTRMVINGRPFYADRSYREARRPEKFDQTPVVPTLPPVREVGRPFLDEDDAIYYRIVSFLDPRAGWLLAEQVMKRYAIGHGTLLMLAKTGVLDPAMEQGSPTKRYRVRDDATLRRLVADLKARMPKAPKAPKKPRKSAKWKE